jgi:hypothetical protein
MSVQKQLTHSVGEGRRDGGGAGRIDLLIELTERIEDAAMRAMQRIGRRQQPVAK